VGWGGVVACGAEAAKGEVEEQGNGRCVWHIQTNASGTPVPHTSASHYALRGLTRMNQTDGSNVAGVGGTLESIGMMLMFDT